MPALIEKAISERPVLMKGEMVRATFADLKTQTRRVTDHLLTFGRISEFGKSDTPGYEWHFRDRRGLWNDISHDRLMYSCPYGKTGDRLWVRETWVSPHPTINPGKMTDFCYRATNPKPEMLKWKPSIFMPRWASRLTLEITDVRVQQLQDISPEDAIAEGIASEHEWDGQPGFGYDMGMYYKDYSRSGVMIGDPVQSYRSLWDSINAKRGFGWDKNPFVWVIVFKRLKEAA